MWDMYTCGTSILLEDVSRRCIFLEAVVDSTFYIDSTRPMDCIDSVGSTKCKQLIWDL